MLKKTDSDAIQSYLEDSSNLAGGWARGVYFPQTETEMIEIIKECSGKRIPLTISGGGTGTTGGRIPFGGWVLSTEKLNQIIELSKKGHSAVFQPAITLDEIDKAAEKEGLTYCPDPTEKTAYLGGTVSTNASGARGLRFGATRRHILRLKVILSSGEVLNIKRGEKINFPRPDYSMPRVKNSAGYFSAPNMDLIDLFIGSEGTLGAISEIEVKLADRMNETFGCVAFFDTEDHAVAFVEKLRPKKEILSIEYFDRNSLGLLRESHQSISQGGKCAVYFEQAAMDNNYLESLEEFFSRNNISLDDVWLGANEKQKKQLREFRAAIPEAINQLYKEKKQLKLSLDIAVPDDKFREMIGFYNSQIPSGLFYIKFGHIGQSHLHVNILPESEDQKETADKLAMLCTRKAVSLGGTVSAEHGIGKIKHAYLKEMYGQKGINEMIKIKKMFDPALIFGLGNIFPL